VDREQHGRSRNEENLKAPKPEKLSLHLELPPNIYGMKIREDFKTVTFNTIKKNDEKINANVKQKQ